MLSLSFLKTGALINNSYCFIAIIHKGPIPNWLQHSKMDPKVNGETTRRLCAGLRPGQETGLCGATVRSMKALMGKSISIHLWSRDRILQKAEHFIKKERKPWECVKIIIIRYLLVWTFRSKFWLLLDIYESSEKNTGKCQNSKNKMVQQEYLFASILDPTCSH